MERIPHLRLAVTSECNFSCKYCRDGGEGVMTKEHMSLHEMVKILEIANTVGFKHLKITGGEPLIREKKLNDVLELIEIVTKLKLFEDVQLVTNGSFLSEYAEKLSKSGLNSLTVSLDTADSVAFKELTGQDKFHDIIMGITKVREYGLPVLINCVVMKQNINELPKLIGIAKKYRTKLKLLDYIDINHSKNEWKKNYVLLKETIDYLKNISIKEDIRLPPGGLGTPMPVYILDGGTEVLVKDATIGTNYNEVCKRCKYYPCQDAMISLRITANGFLKICLIRDDNLVNIIDDLRNEDYQSVAESLESSYKMLVDSIYIKNAWNPLMELPK